MSLALETDPFSPFSEVVRLDDQPWLLADMQCTSTDDDILFKNFLKKFPPLGSRVKWFKLKNIFLLTLQFMWNTEKIFWDENYIKMWYINLSCTYFTRFSLKSLILLIFSVLHAHIKVLWIYNIYLFFILFVSTPPSKCHYFLFCCVKSQFSVF